MQRFALSAALFFTTACSPAAPAPRSQAESRANVREVFRLTCDYLWQLDDYYWHQGQYDRCIAILRLITRIDRRDVEAYSGAAWLMQNQLRDDEAEAFLLEALQNNRDTYEIYFELGFFYYMHERFDEAIRCLEEALRFEPPSRVWNLLAHCYEHAGDIAQALNVWALRDAAEPDNLVPRIQIDRILRGGPPSNGPALARESREERLRERALE